MNKRVWKYITVIGIFLFAVLITYFLKGGNDGPILPGPGTQQKRFENDVTAATPHVSLVRSDGTTMWLDTVRAGLLPGGGIIRKTDSNSLVLLPGADPDSGRVNTLITGIGVRYELILPDGSRVWLNAGSTFQFPNAFSDSSRNVFLSGEACFDIAPSAKAPFTVSTARCSVRVLGTRFNLRAYDGDDTRITLGEGLLRVRMGNDNVVLRPGEQALLSEWGRISIDSANISGTTAWRQDLFWFQSASFEDVMAELCRWYPIHVHFLGKVSGNFSGILPKSHSLIEVLKTLELSGYVHFRIHRNEVEVIPVFDKPQEMPTA
ncbi:MAG TPA: FecR domain-containing protein [Puia sp.]|nr:FecR domain-containing protein [Puia sp.]